MSINIVSNGDPKRKMIPVGLGLSINYNSVVCVCGVIWRSFEIHEIPATTISEASAILKRNVNLQNSVVKLE